MTARSPPTFTSSPSIAMISASFPDAGAAIVWVTLSTSISTIDSSFSTRSPSCFSHWLTVAYSMSADSGGRCSSNGLLPVGLRPWQATTVVVSVSTTAPLGPEQVVARPTAAGTAPTSTDNQVMRPRLWYAVLLLAAIGCTSALAASPARIVVGTGGTDPGPHPG